MQNHIYRLRYMCEENSIGWSDSSHMLEVRDDVWKASLKCYIVRPPQLGRIHRSHVEVENKIEICGETGGPEHHLSSTQHCKSSALGKEKQGTERKNISDVEERFANLLTSFCDKTDNKFSELVTQIVVHHDDKELWKSVYDALNGILFFTIQLKLIVAKYLCKNTDEMDLLFQSERRCKVANGANDS
ncbi:TIFY domain/Divergent CCT motif family protein [Striga asiatica]|uniref:TIFY domain/Divergent CCT motif family protein n=1 Tax=Striga asiatica TaxID=4170 RepID=A0A5A7P8D8_STRAF|nr:TIFY domain/Divergent CCT motif family protein [Striga asiatica]